MLFINKFICLCRGHEWYILGTTIKKDNDDGVNLIDKCSRCGKIEEIGL